MTKNEEKIDYITAEGISYSSLSRLADGPEHYINKEKISGDFLDNGSAVDVLLTEGDEAFHNQFYIMTADKPSSDMMMTYAQTMIETDDHSLALAASGYKSNPNVAPQRNPDALTKWEKEGKPYYDAIKAAGNKIVIDMNQHMKINATVNQLHSNNYTSAYFSPDVLIGSQIIYQFTHYWDFQYTDEKSSDLKKKKAKLKIDILIVNHDTKKIYAKDLKTTGKPTSAFRSSYKKYKYYLQEGLYQEGVMNWRDKMYPDYKVMPFEFIVAQMGAYSEPLIFTIGETEHASNVYGGETGSGYYIKGVADLLEDLSYYETINQWDYTKEVLENNGRINIELFK